MHTQLSRAFSNPMGLAFHQMGTFWNSSGFTLAGSVGAATSTRTAAAHEAAVKQHTAIGAHDELVEALWRAGAKLEEAANRLPNLHLILSRELRDEADHIYTIVSMYRQTQQTQAELSAAPPKPSIVAALGDGE